MCLLLDGRSFKCLHSTTFIVFCVSIASLFPDSFLHDGNVSVVPTSFGVSTSKKPIGHLLICNCKKIFLTRFYTRRGTGKSYPVFIRIKRRRLDPWLEILAELFLSYAQLESNDCLTIFRRRHLMHKIVKFYYSMLIYYVHVQFYGHLIEN